MYLFKQVGLPTLLAKRVIDSGLTSELSLISSKTCALPSVHLCEEVDLHMPLFVTRVIVSAPLFFLCRTNPWVKYNQSMGEVPAEFNFFLILKECYTDMK